MEYNWTSRRSAGRRFTEPVVLDKASYLAWGYRMAEFDQYELAVPESGPRQPGFQSGDVPKEAAVIYPAKCDGG
jgi:hypothetical protein